jgi:ribosomal protein S6--L-glutamate ligase
VGHPVFAGRNPFSPTSITRPGRACEVDGELEEIARSCGRALGLGLYGLDLVEGPEGPVVVDVNTFPGYKGVPDVAPLIADYIEGFALGRYAPTPAELNGAETTRPLSYVGAT